jgi:heme-degrading monooxygenase HmoA
MPIKLNAIWKHGAARAEAGPVHVSMNDYLIHRYGDVVRVGLEGLRLRARWQETEGALGLWVAAFRGGRRQVSISVWRSAEDLKRFVRSPEHLRIMKEFKDAGILYTSAWKAERCDPDRVWTQAIERLDGRVEGVRHH